MKTIIILLLATSVAFGQFSTDIIAKTSYLLAVCADRPSKQHSACSVKKDFIASNWPAELKVLSDLISDVCYNVCLHPELLPSVIIKLNEN